MRKKLLTLAMIPLIAGVIGGCPKEWGPRIVEQELRNGNILIVEQGPGWNSVGLKDPQRGFLATANDADRDGRLDEEHRQSRLPQDLKELEKAYKIWYAQHYI